MNNLNSKIGTRQADGSSNTIVSGRVWRFAEQLSEYKLWSANYLCPDGDGIGLYIANDNGHFELECFSGIGVSKIIMHDIEFSYLQDKVKDLNFKEPFEIQCCKIADYFCRLFCEYKEADDACR